MDEDFERESSGLRFTRRDPITAPMTSRTDNSHMAYAHAPIIEAIIDMQVESAAIPPKSAFESLSSALHQLFPAQVDANTVNLNVSVGPSGQQITSHSVGAGKRLSSAANDRVLVVQPRGMTFSHLGPYSEWSRFRAEAIGLWQKYVEAVTPVAVTRLALRYINRIDLPAGKIELEDYFGLYPETPDHLPLTIAKLFMQITVPQTGMGQGVTAVVNLASAGLRDDGSNGFMLDIDLSASERLTPDTGTVFSRLDELRVRKNLLFESFITDKTRELFK